MQQNTQKGGTSGDKAARVNSVAKALYIQSDKVHHSDCSKISGIPLSDRLDDSVKQPQQWVTTVTPTVKRLKQQIHDIQDFFSKKTKVWAQEDTNASPRRQVDGSQSESTC